MPGNSTQLLAQVLFAELDILSVGDTFELRKKRLAVVCFVAVHDVLANLGSGRVIKAQAVDHSEDRVHLSDDVFGLSRNKDSDFSSQDNVELLC